MAGAFVGATVAVGFTVGFAVGFTVGFGVATTPFVGFGVTLPLSVPQAESVPRSISVHRRYVMTFFITIPPKKFLRLYYLR